MIKKIVLAFAVMVSLSACEQTKTQDYYTSHPDELATDLAECKQNGKSTYNCNEADKAALILQKKN